MFFQPWESRTRHAFVDRSLEVFHEQLVHPDVVQELGEFAVDTLQRIANEVHVADVKHGELVVPERVKHSESSIMTALKDDESVRVPQEIARPTLSQRLKIKVEMTDQVSEEDLREIWDHLKDSPEAYAGLMLKIEAAARARVFAQLTELNMPDGGLFRFAGRPFVVLKWYDARARTTPSDMAHEMRHVQQGLRHPVEYARSIEDLEDLQLRHEFEGYKTELDFIRGMVRGNYRRAPFEVPGYTMRGEGAHISSAATVDNCRMKVNEYSEYDFSVTPEHKRLLDKEGLSDVYDVSHLKLPASWYNSANDSARPGDQNL